MFIILAIIISIAFVFCLGFIAGKAFDRWRSNPRIKKEVRRYPSATPYFHADKHIYEK